MRDCDTGKRVSVDQTHSMKAARRDPLCSRWRSSPHSSHNLTYLLLSFAGLCCQGATWRGRTTRFAFKRDDALAERRARWQCSQVRDVATSVAEREVDKEDGHGFGLDDAGTVSVVAFRPRAPPVLTRLCKTRAEGKQRGVCSGERATVLRRACIGQCLPREAARAGLVDLNRPRDSRVVLRTQMARFSTRAKDGVPEEQLVVAGACESGREACASLVLSVTKLERPRQWQCCEMRTKGGLRESAVTRHHEQSKCHAASASQPHSIVQARAATRATRTHPHIVTVHSTRSASSQRCAKRCSMYEGLMTA